jgi:hypothetical protein
MCSAILPRSGTPLSSFLTYWGSGRTRGGAANTMTRTAAVGFTLACPTQPTSASPRQATPIVVRGRPALTMEIPAPAKAGVAVFTLHRHEQSRGAAVRHQQEWCGPAQEAQTPSGVAPIATKKRASKCTPEKPLVVGPGPIAMAGRRAGAGGSMGVSTERTPPGSDALCMRRASTSWLVATLGTW